jgi:hypothetical protein
MKKDQFVRLAVVRELRKKVLLLLIVSNILYLVISYLVSLAGIDQPVAFFWTSNIGNIVQSVVVATWKNEERSLAALSELGLRIVMVLPIGLLALILKTDFFVTYEVIYWVMFAIPVLYWLKKEE